jgi:hypothetical protein
MPPLLRDALTNCAHDACAKAGLNAEAAAECGRAGP